MSAVYVISKNGKSLMPTTRYGHVRHLLKEGKAEIYHNVAEDSHLYRWGMNATSTEFT